MVKFKNKYILPKTFNVAKEVLCNDFSFVIESNISEQITIQIFDALGNLVHKKEVQVKKGRNEVELGDTKFTNGLFFFNIIDGNSVLFYGKFIYLK